MAEIERVPALILTFSPDLCETLVEDCSGRAQLIAMICYDIL